MVIPAPRWPTTPEDWCALYKRLDDEYDTDQWSPLHHDHRCKLCVPSALERALFRVPSRRRRVRA